IVRILLDHGADVNTAGGEYGSALHGAAAVDHMDIVRILLEHGADVNMTGGRYGSALRVATIRGSKEIVKLLREHGALDSEWDEDSE
ncbi:ankyrin repeat-containing domain protein, partial [Mycena polygramma]